MTKSITILKKRVAPPLDSDPILKLFNLSLSEPLTVEVDFFAEKIYTHFHHSLQTWLTKMGVTAEQATTDVIENKYILIKEVLLRVMARALSCKEPPLFIPDFSTLGVDCTLLENIFYAPTLLAANKKTVKSCQDFIAQAHYLIKCQLRGIIDKELPEAGFHPDAVQYWFSEKNFKHYKHEEITHRIQLFEGLKRIDAVLIRLDEAIDTLKWLPALTGILNFDGLIKIISGLRDDCHKVFLSEQFPTLLTEKELHTTKSLIIPEIQEPKTLTKPHYGNLLSELFELIPAPFQELSTCQQKFSIAIFDADDFALVQPKTPMHKSTSAPKNLGSRGSFFN
ncbi:MAG TPA: hypothetical protein VGV92_07535 [Gammaproteobacteria bacterium]|nr:hypothetical protein [Gammaproteobacteria bacterium]